MLTKRKSSSRARSRCWPRLASRPSALLAEDAGEPAAIGEQPAAQATVRGPLLPEPVECILDQRQRARLVTGLGDHGLLDLAHVEPASRAGPEMISRSPSAAIGGSVQGLPDRLRTPTSRGSSSKRSRKSAPYGRDHEQRAVGIGQRGGEQAVEAAALRRIGEGEQLLELIDREQEGGCRPACGRAATRRGRARPASRSSRTSAISPPKVRASCSASIATGRSPGIIGPIRRQSRSRCAATASPGRPAAGGRRSSARTCRSRCCR